MKYKNIFTKEEEVETIREAGRISAEILNELKSNAVIGKTPKDLHELAIQLCAKNHVEPAFLGVPGPISNFEGAVCISVNDATLHGLPFSNEPFKSGDIIKIDFGIKYKEFLTDHCVTVGLGELSSDEKRLIETAKLCIDTSLKQAVVGNTVGDISNAMQTIADMAGLKYVTSYCGHGIGKELWLEPQITSYGEAGDGPKLEEGMLLCIENQLSLGSAKLKMDDDGWTLRTSDGSKTAMFEHMVLVGKNAPEIITKLVE